MFSLSIPRITSICSIHSGSFLPECFRELLWPNPLKTFLRAPSRRAQCSSGFYMILCYSPVYTIIYYTILYYTILYCTVLYYTILYHTILYYTILYFTIPYYTIIEHYIVLHYIILYYIIVSYHIISYHIILYHMILYYIMGRKLLRPEGHAAPRAATMFAVT